MSRKCTVSADRNSASPVVKHELHEHDDREPERGSANRGRPVARQERHQDRKPQEEVHHVRQDGDDGQDFGREEHLLDQIAAGNQRAGRFVSDDENQVHGRMPQNMKSAYGSSDLRAGSGMTTVKTNV